MTMVKSHFCIGRNGTNEFLALKPNYQAKEPEAVLDMANNLSIVDEKGDYLKFYKKEDAEVFLEMIEAIKARTNKKLFAWKNEYSGVDVNNKDWKVVEVKLKYKYLN